MKRLFYILFLSLGVSFWVLLKVQVLARSLARLRKGVLRGKIGFPGRGPHWNVMIQEILPKTEFYVCNIFLRVPNCVFQKRCFSDSSPRLATEENPLQKDKECLKTPVFLSILVPYALADPDEPLNTPLRKILFRKRRLLLLGFSGWNVKWAVPKKATRAMRGSAFAVPFQP